MPRGRNSKKVTITVVSVGGSNSCMTVTKKTNIGTLVERIREEHSEVLTVPAECEVRILHQNTTLHYDASLSQNGIRNGAILTLLVREVGDACSSSGSSSAGLPPLVASSSDEVPGLT